jgi:hypothetical protein
MKRTNRRSKPSDSPSGARRGWAGPAGEDALGHATTALHRAGFLDATLVLRWRTIAGGDIARIAEPLRLTEGPEGQVLTLKCDPGAAVFLQHQTRELMDRLATYLGPGRITRIRLVSAELGRAEGPPDHPAMGAEGADEASNPSSLSQALERLERRRKRAKRKTR